MLYTGNNDTNVKLTFSKLFTIEICRNKNKSTFNQLGNSTCSIC